MEINPKIFDNIPALPSFGDLEIGQTFICQNKTLYMKMDNEYEAIDLTNGETSQFDDDFPVQPISCRIEMIE